MIDIPITLGPVPDRRDLDTAIACLLGRAPSHLALNEPHLGADGWVATGVYYARDTRERAADELVLIGDVARLLTKHRGRLPRQRRPPEGD